MFIPYPKLYTIMCYTCRQLHYFGIHVLYWYIAICLCFLCTMMVAVAVWCSPPPQHSPMFGHFASSHTYKGMGWDSNWHRESSFFIDRWTQTPYVCSVRKAERSLGTSKTAWTLLLTPNSTQLFTPASCMQLTVCSFSFRRSLWSLLKFFPTGMSVFSHSGSLSLW